MFNNTTTAAPQALPRAFHEEPLEMVIPLMVCCVIAVFSNLFVCYLILTVRRLKTTTNVFVFSLCICNIMFSAVLLPVHCFYQNSLLYLYLVIITVVIYIGNLTAATYERLYSITKPLKYHLVMTKRNAIKITIFAYILPLAYCFLPLIWKTNTTLLVHKIYVVGTLAIFLIGPLVFILFVYIKVCLEIRKMVVYKKKLTISCSSDVDSRSDANSRKNSNTSKSQISRFLCCCNVKSGTMTEMAGIPEKALLDKKPRQKSISFDDSSEAFHERRTASISTDSNQNNVRRDSTDERQSLRSNNLFDRHTKRKSIGNIARSFVSHNSRRKSSTSKTKIKMAELKASFAFAIVAFTYMFTWLPVVVMTTLEALDKQELTPPSLVVFSIFAIALNALTDPFLYALLLPNFRTTLRKILRRRRKSY